jgi:hypothetical protein
MEDSLVSDGSYVDEDEDRKSTEDELDDYVKPSFWLFIERKRKTSSLVELLEVKFYLYCGYRYSIFNLFSYIYISRSSSDTKQKSYEPQAILDELINAFNRLCRTINQVIFNNFFIY